MHAKGWAAAVGLGVIAALASAAGVAAQPRPPASAFAAPPGARLVEMAPGGAQFSAVIATPQGPRLRLYRLTAEGAAQPTFTFDVAESRDVLWTRWVAPDRLVVSRRAPARSEADDDPAPSATRLFAISADGSARIPLVPPDELTGFVTRIQDDVVDFLPADRDHILLAFSNMTPNQPDVVRVNVRTGDSRRIERGRAGVSVWKTSANGAVRLGRGRTRGGQPYLVTRTPSDDGRWRNISHQLVVPDLRFEIVGFAPERAHAYVISNHEGAPAGLYEFDLDREVFERTLYRHSSLDVATAAFANDGARIAHVRLGAADGERVWLDDAAERVWERLSAHFAGRAVERVAISLDGAVETVRVSAPRDPSAYYFYDRRTDESRYAGPQWPGLAGFRLASAQTVAVPARDGASLPGQILAYENDAARRNGQRAPLVILPHAGPGARDLAAFDPLAQFLASRGLAVLRVNVRGTGATALAGEAVAPGDGASSPPRALGRAMIDDVADAAVWTLEQGYADPSALLVAGRGFGGYAALQAAADAPGYFRCVIALDAVSDVTALAPEGAGENELSDHARLARRLWPTPAAMRRESPVRRAADLTSPVFIAHARDAASPFTQSLQLAQGLRRTSGDFEFLDVSGADDGRDPDAATRFYSGLAAFVSRCVGPPPPDDGEDVATPAPSPAAE